jgi:hypothetical protein
MSSIQRPVNPSEIRSLVSHRRPLFRAFLSISRANQFLLSATVVANQIEIFNLGQNEAHSDISTEFCSPGIVYFSAFFTI